MVGDELPYLPAHQGSLAATAVAPRWEVGVAARYRSEVRDVAGAGPIIEAERGDALLTVDASAHVRVRPWAELYLTASNLLDERVVAARRPYGARPNAPRHIVVGYKGRF